MSAVTPIATKMLRPHFGIMTFRLNICMSPKKAVLQKKILNHVASLLHSRLSGHAGRSTAALAYARRGLPVVAKQVLWDLRHLKMLS
jgi:hypothetical protein